MRPFIRGLVALSILGLLIPPVSIAHASELVSLRPPVAKDLVLDAGGLLHGQVVTQDALGQAGAVVTLQRGGREEVARVTADRRGAFTIPGLKSGVYTISSGKATTVARVWQSATAPPKAAQGILLVSDGSILRGKGKGTGGATGLGNAGLGAILAVGALGTIIAVAIAHSDAS